ncbi:hypothetical protein LJC57_08795 [Parabacteroides sp. OttesenSCG-928-G07]|nr:hypothetical protein [Parabacteroides sp. OttesenSCG-928-G21]MDL2278673.1 hypothetical protein [Parabacteroides sp. OttesenSCG-928-G07]
MKRWMISLLGLLFVSVAFAQDIEVKRERNFTGSGLYGFMNGGADQFVEYDVTSLVVRDVVYKGEDFTVEIYQMPTPEDAYGIYSIHVFRCQRADSNECIDCLSPYQLQGVVGNRYYSVVFPSGSSAAQQAATELIRHYLPEEEGTYSIFPKLIAANPPYSLTVKYLRGPLSVHTASRTLNNLLKEHTYKGVWFTAEKSDDVFRALILFNDKTEMDKLKAKLSSEELIQTGDDFLLITGKEQEEEGLDFGPFGF